MLNLAVYAGDVLLEYLRAPSSSISSLRGAPDYSADFESEFHAEAHEQLQVKDLLKVPFRLPEVDSNLERSSSKAPNSPPHPVHTF